jgi:hypothetical protein
MSQTLPQVVTPCAPYLLMQVAGMDWQAPCTPNACMHACQSRQAFIMTAVAARQQHDAIIVQCAVVQVPWALTALRQWSRGCSCWPELHQWLSQGLCPLGDNAETLCVGHHDQCLVQMSHHILDLVRPRRSFCLCPCMKHTRVQCPSSRHITLCMCCWLHVVARAQVQPMHGWPAGQLWGMRAGAYIAAY